jgi:hypothetical protein
LERSGGGEGGGGGGIEGMREGGRLLLGAADVLTTPSARSSARAEAMVDPVHGPIEY